MPSSSEHISPPVPPKRRRSSLLSRKSVVPLLVSSSQEVAHRQYISEAKAEAKEWVDFTSERYQSTKMAEDVLSQITKDPPVSTLETIQGELSKEDTEFLQSQPDYGKLCSDIEHFAKATSILQEKCEHVNSLAQCNMHLLAQARLNAITENICSFNENAPMWLANPGKT